MRFFCGSNHLSELGGSETFTFAMVEELVRLGHEVDVICPAKSDCLIADALYRLGVSTNDLDGIETEQYDAAFLSHSTTVEMLFRLFPNFPPAKVIQTIHGSLPALEKPYHDGHRMIQYVTISDELRELYPYSTTIMNGVNLDRFKPAEKIPGSVLSMCQSETFNVMLSEICAELDLTFKSRNKFTNPIWEIETELATAEIAIGIGRSAIEAMACGCAVIIADHRPYQEALMDGWAIGLNAECSAKCNYSGREAGLAVTRANMRGFLQSAKNADDAERKADVIESRAYAEQHHDIREQVQRYLEIVNA